MQSSSARGDWRQKYLGNGTGRPRTHTYSWLMFWVPKSTDALLPVRFLAMESLNRSAAVLSTTDHHRQLHSSHGFVTRGQSSG